MNLDILTTRERQVYERVAGGMSRPQVAAEVGISVANVNVTMCNARKRLESGVRGKVQRPHGSERQREQAALMRSLNEPRCRRCAIHGHLEGDPVRCLPTSAVAYATRRGDSPDDVYVDYDVAGEKEMQA